MAICIANPEGAASLDEMVQEFERLIIGHLTSGIKRRQPLRNGSGAEPNKEGFPDHSSEAHSGHCWAISSKPTRLHLPYDVSTEGGS
jgi:hypothetical protein